MGPRDGLDGYGKFRPPTGIRLLDRPARSQSLHLLSYLPTERYKFQINRQLLFNNDCENSPFSINQNAA